MKHLSTPLGTLIGASILLLTTNISSAQNAPGTYQEFTLRKQTDTEKKALAVDQAALNTTTSPSSTGIVSSSSPDRIVVKKSSSSDPVNYAYTKNTTYVDENGKAVDNQTVKSGALVTVSYTHVGDQMVATKVIIKKPTATTKP